MAFWLLDMLLIRLGSRSFAAAGYWVPDPSKSRRTLATPDIAQFQLGDLTFKVQCPSRIETNGSQYGRAQFPSNS